MTEEGVPDMIGKQNVQVQIHYSETPSKGWDRGNILPGYVPTAVRRSRCC